MNRKDILKTIKSIITNKTKTTSIQIICSEANQEACPGLEQEKKIS